MATAAVAVKLVLGNGTIVVVDRDMKMIGEYSSVMVHGRRMLLTWNQYPSSSSHSRQVHGQTGIFLKNHILHGSGTFPVAAVVEEALKNHSTAKTTIIPTRTRTTT